MEFQDQGKRFAVAMSDPSLISYVFNNLTYLNFPSNPTGDISDECISEGSCGFEYDSGATVWKTSYASSTIQRAVNRVADNFYLGILNLQDALWDAYETDFNVAACKAIRSNKNSFGIANQAININE